MSTDGWDVSLTNLSHATLQTLHLLEKLFFLINYCIFYGNFSISEIFACCTWLKKTLLRPLSF